MTSQQMSSPLLPFSAVHDFGGNGPVVHLAHANGFPPGTYRLLAGTLTSDYHVIALPSRALWPGSQPDSTPTWHPLADDLIQGLDEMRLHDIVGVGHSIGAVLTLWAAIRRADLFRAVVLIEPVLLPPAWLWMLRLMRGLGLGQRQPLVQGALHRRRTWSSREACFEHFRTKALFARWPDAALHDYVESGTHLLPGGQVELAYPPEWEAHIFATTPTHIWRDVPRLRTPVLVVRGERSQAFRPAAQARLARQLPQGTFVTLSGAGHLVPMERPEETGAAICTFLKDLAAGRLDPGTSQGIC
jgi:pimeloyl-ACP methyl ester carboxylesterase